MCLLFMCVFFWINKYNQIKIQACCLLVCSARVRPPDLFFNDAVLVVVKYIFFFQGKMQVCHLKKPLPELCEIEEKRCLFVQPTVFHLIDTSVRHMQSLLLRIAIWDRPKDWMYQRCWKLCSPLRPKLSRSFLLLKGLKKQLFILSILTLELHVWSHSEANYQHGFLEF